MMDFTGSVAGSSICILIRVNDFGSATINYNLTGVRASVRPNVDLVNYVFARSCPRAVEQI